MKKEILLFLLFISFQDGFSQKIMWLDSLNFGRKSFSYGDENLYLDNFIGKNKSTYFLINYDYNSKEDNFTIIGIDLESKSKKIISKDKFAIFDSLLISVAYINPNGDYCFFANTKYKKKKKTKHYNFVYDSEFNIKSYPNKIFETEETFWRRGNFNMTNSRNILGIVGVTNFPEVNSERKKLRIDLIDSSFKIIKKSEIITLDFRNYEIKIDEIEITKDTFIVISARYNKNHNQLNLDSDFDYIFLKYDFNGNLLKKTSLNNSKPKYHDIKSLFTNGNIYVFGLINESVKPLNSDFKANRLTKIQTTILSIDSFDIKSQKNEPILLADTFPQKTVLKCKEGYFLDKFQKIVDVQINCSNNLISISILNLNPEVQSKGPSTLIHLDTLGNTKKYNFLNYNNIFPMEMWTLSDIYFSQKMSTIHNTIPYKNRNLYFYNSNKIRKSSEVFEPEKLYRESSLILTHIDSNLNRKDYNLGSYNSLIGVSMPNKFEIINNEEVLIYIQNNDGNSLKVGVLNLNFLNK